MRIKTDIQFAVNSSKVKRTLIAMSMNFLFLAPSFGQGGPVLPTNSIIETPINSSNSNNSTFLTTLLLSFQVKANDRNAMIQWSTFFETDFYLFTIERTTDIVNWETIHQIEGVGNTSGESLYTWVDENPYLNNSYYRLKIEDLNGNMEYSDIKSFSLSGTEGLNIMAYPNPVSSYLLIEGTATDLENLTIKNAYGLEVNSIAPIIWEGTNQLGIDVSALPSGYYYLKATTNVVKISKL